MTRLRPFGRTPATLSSSQSPSASTPDLERQALLLETEREQQDRAAVAEERARIARELHDAIGSRSPTAMRSGASGFLLKDVRPEQLAEAVRTVAAGDALLAPAITRRLIEEFVRRPPPGQQRPPELDELTERELEMLTLIARSLSSGEIGKELYVSEATVKTHVTRILAKLRLPDRVQAVALAYESGLVEAGTGDARDWVPGR
jgi:DNA-binding NarL/FixJ family response regulator